jgi:hypothetical protein
MTKLAQTLQNIQESLRQMIDLAEGRVQKKHWTEENKYKLNVEYSAMCEENERINKPKNDSSEMMSGSLNDLLAGINKPEPKEEFEEVSVSIESIPGAIPRADRQGKITFGFMPGITVDVMLGEYVLKFMNGVLVSAEKGVPDDGQGSIESRNNWWK